MELKPCPFCGGEAKIELVEVDSPVTFFDLYYCVVCTKHPFSYGYARISRLPEFCPDEVKAAKKKLADQWNRRAGNG